MKIKFRVVNKQIDGINRFKPQVRVFFIWIDFFVINTQHKVSYNPIWFKSRKDALIECIYYKQIK